MSSYSSLMYNDALPKLLIMLQRCLKFIQIIDYYSIDFDNTRSRNYVTRFD